MNRFLLTLLALGGWCVGTVRAQEPYDDRRYDREMHEWEPMIRSDSSVFYRAVQSTDDLYARAADYPLSFVSTARRGVPFYRRSCRVEGIALSSAAVRAFDLLAVALHHDGGVDPLATARTPYRRYDLMADEGAGGGRAALRFTDRTYRVGARLRWSGRFGRGWSFGTALDARMGRDLRIDGVFAEGVTAAVRAATRWSGGPEIAFEAALPIEARGLRSASTAEAFALTGDRYYNPSWGLQKGRMRNSRVRRTALPHLVGVLRTELSPSTRLVASVAAEAGIVRQSALEWFDARTPQPDNYRKLPSWFDDPQSASLVEAFWRAGDARYTQIDWDELYAENRMRGGDAAFVLADRAQRRTDLQASLYGLTEALSALTIRYGLDARYERTRNYKEVRDLLGADYLTDIDCFLVDDDTYRNALENDLRHPSRRVGEGDRFGYDYALVRRTIGAFVSLEYRADRFRLDASVRATGVAIRRKGYYEKELFAGTASLGPSRRLEMNPFAGALALGWAFTPRHYLGLRLRASAEPPEAQDLFLQPQYNNRTIDDPRLGKGYGAELDYRFNGRALTVQTTLYALSERDGTDVMRHYDDLAGAYCDRVVTNIGRLFLGAEATLGWRPAYRWTLTFTAAATQGSYTDDALLALYRDTDNSVVASEAPVRLGDCRPGGVPQLAFTLAAGYFGRGWGFRLSGAWVGGRYVEPDPLRRTDRVARQAAESPEAFAALVAQERLPDALDVGAFVWKSFRVGGSPLTVSLTVRNLLGDTHNIHAGYESPRLRRVQVGDAHYLRPLDNRYTCALPRTFYLSVSYRF